MEATFLALIIQNQNLGLFNMFAVVKPVCDNKELASCSNS
jgi:hypothetical protein